MLFLQENKEDNFLKMKKKTDEGLNFKIWVFTYHFNQITQEFTYF